MFGEKRPYIIQYYLVDDTVEVREVHEPNDGRDPFPVFLRRQKLPKDRYNVECKLSLILYCVFVCLFVCLFVLVLRSLFVCWCVLEIRRCLVNVFFPFQQPTCPTTTQCIMLQCDDATTFVSVQLHVPIRALMVLRLLAVRLVV